MTQEGERLEDRIAAAAVGTLFRNVARGVLGAAAAAVVLAALVAVVNPVYGLGAAAWAAGVCACAALHLLLLWRRRGREAGWRFWAGCFTGVAFLEGCLWGVSAFWLVDPTRFDEQLIVMLVTYAMAGGSLTVFSAYLPTLWCFFVPTTVPFAILLLLDGGTEHTASGILAVIYVIGMGAIGRRTHFEFIDGLRLRFEVDELARALARQKDRAEQANLAKSRFLAAASHDLRQPVHALSLSVGALREMAMAPDAEILVSHIEQSVAALDGLFSALLDISRLDAAVVVPQPRAFAIQPVIDRVCRDLAPETAAKGLALRNVPCSLAVRTDPVLLERILRNLVSNAVRYTDTGRVLVGCRRAGGLRVDVWDTGRGIPQTLHERVFEEYYQVGNPQRDRRAGLGLGLAIVRRLTALLDLPLALRSREEGGTVFSLTLPIAQLPPIERQPMISARPRQPQRLVLVIDDEPVIQVAMSALLERWGFAVIAAGSCAAMLERLAHCPVRPALLVCDYRLGDEENGIATIQRLQSEYNDELPAILITGDTAPGRLLDAMESGLTLLHKPVEHGRLRSAIDQALMEGATPIGALLGGPPPPVSG